MKPSKLFNVEVWNGKIKQSTPYRNITYAIAQVRKKELISKGTFARNIWIVPNV